MALKAPKGGNNKDFVEQPVLEPDVYPARLVQIIDLGLQAQREYQGKAKPPAQEIMLTYELVDCFMVDAEGEELEDKPRWISETLPFYGLFADKAKSTQRYHAFDPDEEWEGDFSQAIGMPCNVTIVVNKKGDKVYTNVANVAPMSAKKAEKLTGLKNDPKVFDLDEPDMEIFKALPKWIQDKITSNLNFKGSTLEGLLGDAPAKKEEKKAPAPKKKAEQEDPPFEPDDQDDNPY
jgi:hypothetical protein